MMSQRLIYILTIAALIASPAAQAKAKAKSKAQPKPRPKAATQPADSQATGKSPLEQLKLVEGDENGNEVKSLKAELLVSHSENAAIAQAKKLIKKYKGTPLEPELHFRLAELYMRKSKTDRFFEVHRESDTIVHLAPRLVKDASSRATIQHAVDSYQTIQKRFPSFGQMDLVVFNHAFARQALGEEKEAEVLYRNLINNYSTSFLVPDAHLAVGEIEFGRGNFQFALEHFNAIRKYPESRVYPYGLYKAAWTHYNMRDAVKGLKKLEEVVAYGKMVAETKAESSRLDLRKEALSDMTLFYEEVYPSKDAYAYFREQAGDSEVGPILLRMAKLYERHSRFGDQRVVLNQFIARLPASPLLPQVYMDSIEANDHLRQKDRAVSGLDSMSDLCKADGSWVRSQTKDSAQAKKTSSDCLNMLNTTSLKLAKKWLRAWKKLPSDTTYADASEKAFEIYFRSANDSEEALQSRYAYADLLFARGKYRRASAEYAYVGRAVKTPQIEHDASYGAVVSLEKAVGEKWSADDEREFHKLASDYVKRNPKGQYRLDIEYKMALLAYEKERYDEAAPSFLRLGREFPKKEKGIKAQDLYLDILNIKKDYRGIRQFTQEVMKANGDATRTAKMQKLYERAYFLEIQGLEDKNDYKEALNEYLNFAKQNPNSDLAEKAMWNALQLQFKVGDALNGSKTAVEFASRFPKSDQAVNSLLRAAQTFEQMAQLKEAADVLMKLADREPKNANRWHELAADFYAMDGETATARKLYGDLKSTGDAANRMRMLNKIELFEKDYGTKQAHNDALKALIDMNVQPQAHDAKVEMVEAMLEHGKQTDAFNEARRWLGPNSTMTANQKARLRLVQAKVLEQEFLKQSVKSRVERVAQVLAIKTEKLQKAQEAFQSAIRYGDPRVSVEAFERLYGCYSHYVTALKDMPVPAGLNADDAKAFRGEIDNLVIPLEEKSVDTLAQAVQFARKQQFLDGTAARLEGELNKVNQTGGGLTLPELHKPEPMIPLLAGVSP
jgi:TolA-binding protein